MNIVFVRRHRRSETTTNLVRFKQSQQQRFDCQIHHLNWL